MKENIPGCPGYHVTRNGKVYSNKLGGWVRKSSFNTKPHDGRNCGYEYVVLNIRGKQKGFGVHKLVAMAYIPNPNNYPIVMHLDNSRTNNRVSNLMWGTPKMNLAQMAREGRSTRKYRFSKRQYRRLVRLRERGWTLQRLADKFGVGLHVIYRVLRSDYFGE